jgi:hypothetical protein
MQLISFRSRESEISFLKKINLYLLTGRGGPKGCETSGFAHFLDNLLTDGGGDISLDASRSLPPGRFLVFIPVRG